MKAIGLFAHGASLAVAFVASVGAFVPHAEATSVSSPDYAEIIDCPVPGEIEGRPGYGVYIDRNSGSVVAITNQGGFVGGSTTVSAKLSMTRNSQGSCLVQISDDGATPSYYHVRAQKVYLGGQWRSCAINDFYNDWLNQMCEKQPATPQQPQPQPQPNPHPGAQGDQPATVLCGNELDRYELMSAYKSGVASYSLQAAYDKVMARVCPREYVSGPTAGDNRNDCMTESGRYARVSQYRGNIPRCGRECAHDYVLAQVCSNYSQVVGRLRGEVQNQAPVQTESRWWRGDTSEFSRSHTGTR